jgi:hypothetical protein
MALAVANCSNHKISKTAESHTDVGYWSDQWCVGGKSGAKIRFRSFCVTKATAEGKLKVRSCLETVAVIRQPNATNYKITQQKWQRIYKFYINFTR